MLMGYKFERDKNIREISLLEPYVTRDDLLQPFFLTITILLNLSSCVKIFNHYIPHSRRIRRSEPKFHVHRHGYNELVISSFG